MRQGGSEAQGAGCHLRGVTRHEAGTQVGSSGPQQGAPQLSPAPSQSKSSIQNWGSQLDPLYTGKNSGRVQNRAGRPAGRQQGPGKASSHPAESLTAFHRERCQSPSPGREDYAWHCPSSLELSRVPAPREPKQKGAKKKGGGEQQPMAAQPSEVPAAVSSVDTGGHAWLHTCRTAQ